MIEITDKKMCCGCGACVNICPKKCITMEYDDEGYLYPKVDTDKCIKCNQCDKVCHLKSNDTISKEYINKIEFYGAYNKEIDVVKVSSSGGIFWILAKYIIANNGVVYGVEQPSTYEVLHSRAETLERCEKFRRSKYLQSNVKMTYTNVKNDLELKRQVLFTGTPCQIAGLYSFLGKIYENLYTCDVVCHGVPSIAVYKKYISEFERKHNSKVINVRWRDKVKGWGPNRVTLFLENGKEVTSISQENMFQKGFLDNVYLRPSCYECKYARFPRIGDISLADFWGYEGELSKKNSNSGLSIIILSSLKGTELFNNIKNELVYHSVSEEYVKQKSRHAYLPPVKNYDRKRFFKDFNSLTLEQLSEKYIKPHTFSQKVFRKVRRFVDSHIYR